MVGRIPWSSLPEDLSSRIGQCLDTRFDIMRFRSVCSKWRNSLPFSPRNWHHHLPLYKLPHSDEDARFLLPVNALSDSEDLSSFNFILRFTVYILNQVPASSPISTPWLLKLEETEQGKLRILNPVSDTPVKDFPTASPKVSNLLDYSIVEVGRGYISIDTGDERAKDVCISKVVILPESDRISTDDDFMFLELVPSGHLLLGGKYGDGRLTIINEGEVRYDDIAFYRGHFVAIDRYGIVSFVDSSSSKLVQYTPPILNGGQKKHLVVSSEHLYAVDRYFDRPRKSNNPYREVDAKVVSFKLYKLDEDLGWIEITSLDDRILFLSKGLNFFVPIKGVSGCRGNYIIFMDDKYNDKEDEFRGSSSTVDGIVVFDMVDRRIGKLSSFPGCSDMVWPPPSWFTANELP